MSSPIQELPPAYRASKTSPYRQRVAALAQPLPGQILGRMEVAKAIFAAVPDPGDILIDLPALAEGLRKTVEMAERVGMEPPAPGACRTADEQWRRMFYDRGIFFDVVCSNLCTGPLMAEHKIDGLDIFLVGVANPLPGGASAYAPPRMGGEMPARIIVDASGLLEEAVYKINIFRYLQLEPVCSVLFTTREHEEGPREALFKRRLKGILPAGEFKKHDFRRAFDDLREGSMDTAAMNTAFIRILIMRFMGLTVRSLYAEDEAEHALNLCNHVAHSTLVTQLAMHRELERLKAEEGVTGRDPDEMEALIRHYQEHLDFVGWLSDIAYGDAISRIDYISQHGFMCGSPSAAFFKKQGMRPIIEKAVIQPTLPTNPMDGFFNVLTCPAERFSRAARERLDEVFEDLTGRPFVQVHPGLMEAFERVNRTTFITRDMLPTLAEIWKRENLIVPDSNSE